MERLIAALVMLREAIERLAPVFIAAWLGKAVAEYRAMKSSLKAEREAREIAKANDDYIATLGRDELQHTYLKGQARLKLRLKARVSDGGGGSDD